MTPWREYCASGPESPCYDRKTKVSCANRSSVCRQSCEAWKEYERIKMEEYQARKEEHSKNDEYYRYIRRNNIKREKTEKRLKGKKVLRR